MSILGAFIFSISLTSQLYDESGAVFVASVIFCMFLMIYIIGFYSMFQAYFMLTKPGISGSVRNLILIRHTAGILVFFICDLYVFAFTFEMAFNI